MQSDFEDKTRTSCPGRPQKGQKKDIYFVSLTYTQRYIFREDFSTLYTEKTLKIQRKTAIQGIPE